MSAAQKFKNCRGCGTLMVDDEIPFSSDYCRGCHRNPVHSAAVYNEARETFRAVVAIGVGGIGAFLGFISFQLIGGIIGFFAGFICTLIFFKK